MSYYNNDCAFDALMTGRPRPNACLFLSEQAAAS